MSLASLAIIAIIMIYYTYDNLLIVYRYYKEELDIEPLGYLHLSNRIPPLIICSIAGNILTFVGIVQNSYIVVGFSLFALICCNVEFKWNYRKEKKRDYHQEELDYYDEILENPKESEERKEIVRRMREITVELHREQCKEQMKNDNNTNE